MAEPQQGEAARRLSEVEARLDRIETAIETMAAWLVQAQTGFAERDAQGITEILYKQTVTNPDDSPITSERPRDVGAPGAAT